MIADMLLLLAATARLVRGLRLRCTNALSEPSAQKNQ